MGKPLRVLMVEDSEDDVLLTVRALKKGGYDPVFVRVEDAGAMRKALQEKTWDAIVCDYQMPQFNGLAAIALLKETGIDIPLIIVSGVIGEETAADCMRYGAHDYVMKGNLARLVPAIERELMEAKSRSRTRQAEKALRENEERFRRVSSMISDVAYSCSMKEDGLFSIDWMEGGAERISGYSIEEIKARQCWRSLVIEEDLALFDTNVTNLSPGSHALCELRIQRKSGAIAWVESYAECVRMEMPERFILYGALVDITERKRVGESLQDSQELLSLFMRHSPVYTYIKEVTPTESRVLQASDNYDQMIGIPGPKMIGRTMPELFPQEFADKITADDWAVVSSGNVLQLDEDLNDRNYTTIKFPIYQRGKTLLAGYTIDITERKRAERALRKSEGKYRNLFENANESIFVAQDAKLVLANPMTTMMTGYSAEELTSRPFIEFIHPDDRGMVIDRHVRRFKGEEIPHTYSFRIIRKDGSIRWGNLSAVLISWEGKQATLNFFSDITDLQRADEALKQSEAKYRDIFDKTLEGIYRSTPEGKFDILNPAFARICGYASPEEMMEKVTDIANQLYANPEDRSRFQKLIAAEEEVKGFELQFKHPTKGQVWISLNARAIRDEQGNIRYYDGTIEDISERKRAEELLKKNEEKYRNLFDNAVEGVFQSTPEGRLISVNTAFARMFGYNSAEEIVNTVTDIASQVYANPDDRKIAVRMMTETGYINNFECQMRRKDGGTFWARYDGHVTETEDGINCFQGFIIDISERRQSEEKLQQTLENLRKAFIASIQLLVSAVESRDPYTAGHQIRSTNLARAIATEMGLPRDKIEGLRMAGSIHDIGKLSIPAEILSKPTRLTNIEFSLIKEHARAGYEMLKDVESPWPLAEIVHQHHERMDGSGYPRNLKGEEILMEARILAVADVVESMASHRPYRPAIGIEAALEEIKKNKGILYDDAVADACLRLFREKGFKL